MATTSCWRIEHLPTKDPYDTINTTEPGTAAYNGSRIWAREKGGIIELHIPGRFWSMKWVEDDT